MNYTDLDRLKDMFDRAGIKYVETHKERHFKAATTLTVEDGYPNFVAEFWFDDVGALLRVAAWEQGMRTFGIAAAIYAALVALALFMIASRAHAEAGYVAKVLVCRAGVQPSDCTEQNAYDVVSATVANELSCQHGWQEIIARGALKDMAAGTYIKAVCRRT